MCNICFDIINVEFFIVDPGTFHIKYSKFPPPRSVHAWTHMIMDFHTFSKVLGRFRMIFQAQNLRW